MNSFRGKIYNIWTRNYYDRQIPMHILYRAYQEERGGYTKGGEMLGKEG